MLPAPASLRVGMRLAHALRPRNWSPPGLDKVDVACCSVLAQFPGLVHPFWLLFTRIEHILLGYILAVA